MYFSDFKEILVSLDATLEFRHKKSPTFL